jgi:hypothetical protein
MPRGMRVLWRVPFEEGGREGVREGCCLRFSSVHSFQGEKVGERVNLKMYRPDRGRKRK